MSLAWEPNLSKLKGNQTNLQAHVLFALADASGSLWLWIDFQQPEVCPANHNHLTNTGGEFTMMAVKRSAIDAIENKQDGRS